MTTAIATLEPTAPLVTAEDLDLVKRTVAAGATDAELRLFLFDCKRRGVHPLDKLIHFTKRSGKYTPVTSIDFMRSQAAMTGEMAGSDDPMFTPKYVEEHPDEATVSVYRLTQGHRYAYTATARWNEYKPEQNDFMWRKMPHTMLGKCAEALALRKAFPQQLAGLYAQEELEQAPIDSPSVPETPAAKPKAIKPAAKASPLTPFGEFLALLEAAADKGEAALRALWEQSDPAFKKIMKDERAADWMALKQRAVQASAKAAAPLTAEEIFREPGAEG